MSLWETKNIFQRWVWKWLKFTARVPRLLLARCRWLESHRLLSKCFSMHQTPSLCSTWPCYFDLLIQALNYSSILQANNSWAEDLINPRRSMIDWLIKLGFNVVVSNKLKIHHSHEVIQHTFRCTWSSTITLESFLYNAPMMPTHTIGLEFDAACTECQVSYSLVCVTLGKRYNECMRATIATTNDAFYWSESFLYWSIVSYFLFFTTITTSNGAFYWRKSSYSSM